jgi:TM2 domain-containing membrane protein YozV
MLLKTMALAENAAPLYDDFTPKKISSFACSLIQNGEYYRGYVELLRLNSFYPSYISSSTFDITASYLFYKSKRYNDILNFDFNEIDKSIVVPFSIFRIDSLFKLNRRDDADTELSKLNATPDSKEYAAYLNKRKVYLSALMNKSYDKNTEEFLQYKGLFEYSNSVHENMKKPLYGALAGIIPGMGYFYAGEKGTALVSIIIIGTGSAVTYASYINGLGALSVITGAITFFFYGGSIIGGYMQCKKNNEYLMDTLNTKLERELMLDRDLDEIYLRFGLCSNDFR